MTDKLTLAKLRRARDVLFEDQPPWFLMPLPRGGRIIRRVRERAAAAQWRARWLGQPTNRHLCKGESYGA